MKEYIPDYYKDFQCIADKCKDSCCIGWEIMIDSKSYKKYQNVKGEFRDRLMKGIDHEGTPAFHLDDRDRCVFLNQKNLKRDIFFTVSLILGVNADLNTLLCISIAIKSCVCNNL